MCTRQTHNTLIKKTNPPNHMFQLKAPFKPSGDQPKAIEEISKGLKKGYKMQTLLGVTGSGKSYVAANIIQNYSRPTIVLAHNKTLAFQLYKELKEFFPDNRVEFFISYYDYYQPESYLPSTDTYIEKDAKINPKIEQMRLSATVSLLTRPDTIIVASVSAIYGLGDPTQYAKHTFRIEQGQEISRRELLQHFLKMQYERNDTDLKQGTFRVKGSTIDIIPTYLNTMVRISLQGNTIASIQEYTTPNIELKNTYDTFTFYPAKHFVVEDQVIDDALIEIEAELKEQLPVLEKENALFAHRLKQRVNYDMEMIKEMGYCNGIENYSRFFDKRKQGEKPYCLLDFFPEDFLMIIDESHQTIPQFNGMYKGDRSRKQSLVEYGFRLPSALDNRPLRFEEFSQFMNHVVFVSATPATYELEHSSQISEMIVRPTGLVDPLVEIRPSKGQMDDLIKEIKETKNKGYRTLVTTLTKRLAEELTEYLADKGIKVRYLHSEIDSLERIEIIRQLRLGKFDVLIGINLLREGLDIPEVALVGILDADKEGFLRNDKSLIQTIGRAARNSESKVILYADNMTDSMHKTIKETNRRRGIQLAYNKEHDITPQTIIKPVEEKEITLLKDDKHLPKKEIPNLIIELEAQMKKSAEELDFEQAIKLRNKIEQLHKRIKQQ
ncbi:MAG: excinuclease ABC subunit UvrB [Nanoarchaeota archaeon]|nr:excinuclease ABC subunit UvrB [Nanoarchaeota archaeon]